MAITEVLGGVESTDGYGFDWGPQDSLDYWEGDHRITLRMELHHSGLYVDIQPGIPWQHGPTLNGFDCVRLRTRLSALAQALGLTLHS